MYESKTWYGDYYCPRCHGSFTPRKSNQIYCCKECCQQDYYDGKVMNNPKYKMTKALKKKLESDITYILNPNAKGYPYEKIWNSFKEYGLVNENSLIINLKKNGFDIVNDMVIKLI